MNTDTLQQHTVPAMPAFRVGTPGDFARVTAFYDLVTDYSNAQAYGPCWQKDVHPSRAFLSASLQNGRLYLLEQGDTILAAMVLNHETHPAYQGVPFAGTQDPQQVYVIHLLCVHPRHYGKGYAKRMLSEAVRIGREDGMQSLWLDVLYNNVSAVQLYRSFGFRLAATIPGMYDVFIGPTDGELYEYPLI